MQRALLILLAMATVVAGCVTPPAEDVPPEPASEAWSAFVPDVPDFDWTTVVDPDHGSHQLPDLHMGGHGLSLTGHASIADVLGAGTRGSITQVDVWGDYAVVSGMEGGLAFAIVDISDPASPKAVSSFPSAADGWTARFSDDGNYVFYGCQMLGAPYVTGSLVVGTCEDPSAPHAPGAPASGVIVVDVTDKASPKFVHFLAVGGSHNIFVTSIDGVDYVFTASTAILKFDRETMELELLTEVPGVHDSTVAKHPITGDWLLFTGTGQLTIYNVNDPASPEIVYDGEADENDTWVGWHEQTLVPNVVDGRVILVVAGETSQAASGGVPDKVFFLNVTDPAHPELLSEFVAPWGAMVPWTGYLYSVHEIAATPTGQIAVSWYHGGMWVLDVSTKERQESPAVLAAYLPHELPNVVPSTFFQTPMPVVPFVWGAGWDDRGYLIVPDMHTGLYVLEPDWGLVAGIDGGQ